MATARHRTQSWVGDPGGSAIALSQSVNDYDQGPINYSQEMWDWVGNRKGVNPMELHKTNPVVGHASGRTSGYFTCSDWAHTDVLGEVSPSSSPPSQAEAVLEAISRTNPSRPEVDLPVFLFEFRELPRMVKQLGDLVSSVGHFTRKDIHRIAGNSPKLGAEALLAVEFGWRPLLGDLGKMLDFVVNTENRIQELTRLQSDKGLRRNAKIWDDTVEGGQFYKYIGPSYGAAARVWLRLQTERHWWVSLVWRPSATFPELSEEDIVNTARKYVWGLNISAATVWQAMPWSWLIDWFGNVGDFLEANRNRADFQAYDICLMESTETTCKFEGFRNNPWGASFSSTGGLKGTYKRTVIPTYPLPSFHLPFLDGRQWSILSSLAVLKLGK